MENIIPVLIIGAGPTGLAMAVELLRYNIPFRIIDQQIKPVTTSNALMIQPRTLEVWDDIGLLDRALARGITIFGINLYTDKTLLGQLDTYNLNTLHPYLLALSQSDTEKMLHEFLKENSIHVELETTLNQLKEKNNCVEVQLINKNGEQEILYADWIIACDGTHSQARKLINMPFEGKELPQHFVMGDVEISSSLTKNRVHGFFSKKGVCMVIPFNQKYSRILFEVSNESKLAHEKKPSTEQLKQLLKERCDFPIQVNETIWTSGFSIHEKIVRSYKQGRVFFAGDAAHEHSPAGGQGMNTGIQDAYNLGWKLANVIQKLAKEDLLETYHEERWPVAKNVLIRSSLMTRFVAENNKIIFYIRNFLMYIFLKTKLATKFLALNSELTIKYRPSKLTVECNKSLPGPKAGEQILDCWLDDSKQERLLSYIQGTKPVILVFSGILRESKLPIIKKILDEIKNKYNNLFRYAIAVVNKNDLVPGIEIINDIEQKLHRKYEVTIPTIYFIRPDKYIGFRGKISDQSELIKYLEKFFG